MWIRLSRHCIPGPLHLVVDFKKILYGGYENNIMTNKNNNALANKSDLDNRYLPTSSLDKIEEDLISTDLSLFGSTEAMNKIITRASSEKIAELKILNKNQLATMAEDMKEIDRATTSFGRTQSSYMNYLMTVSAYTPVRNARQILAEIENRRQALKENIFKQKKEILEMKKKQTDLDLISEELQLVSEKIDQYTSYLEYTFNQAPEGPKKIFDLVDTTLTLGKIQERILELKKRYNDLVFQIATLRIEIQETQSKLVDGRLYIEGALKTVYQHQQKYKEIVDKFNLKNWDEVDFEKEEARYHVTTAFAQALEDTCSRGGVVDKGDLIYMRQIGIHPLVATQELQNHMNKITALINGDKRVGSSNDYYEVMEAFFNEMADKYADSALKVLKSKGIENWYDEDSSYRDRNKKPVENMDEKIRGEATKEDSSKWSDEDDLIKEAEDILKGDK